MEAVTELMIKVGGEERRWAQRYRRLWRRRTHLSRQKRTELAQMTERLDVGSQSMSDEYQDLIGKAGARELTPALKSGVLDLHDLSLEKETGERDLGDVFGDAMTAVLAESVGAGANVPAV